MIVVTSCFAMMQSASTENRVKAGFIYNFAKFVDWPARAFRLNSRVFTICLAGDPFEGELDTLIKGELLDGRRLTVHRLAEGEGARGCQILYVAPSEAHRFKEIVGTAANDPILTVGESEDFIDEGGIVRFVKTDERIHFQINPDAAQHAALKVSSRLLRLAEIVRPRRRRASLFP